MHISSNTMSATNISKLLLQNINETLPVETQLDIALHGASCYQLYLYLQ